MKKPMVAPDLTGMDFMQSFTAAELKKTDTPKVRVPCCIVGCKCYIGMKDFGQHPFYFYGGKWVNLDQTIWYCGKHWKAYKAGILKDEHFKDGPASEHLKTDNQ